MKKDTNLFYPPYALIAVISVLLYAKTLFFGLTFLDDDLWLIGQQAYLRGIKNVFTIFTAIDISGAYYRPMITLSFLIDSKLNIFYPHAVRVTNIILHILNSCLVFKLLEEFQFRKKAALGFALVFAVHPALVQTVAWVPGRTDSLLSIFVLPAVISFIFYLRENDGKWLTAHCISFFFALLTKETAVVLPAVCSVYWVCLADRTKTGRAMKKISLSWCAAVLAWYILRKIALGGGEVVHWGMINAFIINTPAILLYFGKVFAPVNLTVLPVLRDSNLWVGALSAVTASVLLFASRSRNNKLVFFGAFWFCVFLAPAFAQSFVFPEYRLYIPIIGIFIVVGEMKVFKVLERYSVGALVVGAIVMYFLIALNYADTYKDRLTFWKDAAAYSKSSPMTHINLAHAYYAYGQSEMAEEEFQISLALVPGAPTVNYNIGVIRYERGEYSGARQSCLAELKNNPSYGPAVNLLKAMDKAPNGPPL